MVPSCFSERAGRDVLVRVTCGSLYSPGSSNVGSVRKRNSAISMSAVGPPMRVILGVFMGLHNEAGPPRHGQGQRRTCAAALSDQLIGAGEHCRRDSQTELFGGL